MKRKGTIGLLVDEVADQYIAAGMDSFTAGIKACLDVANAQVKLLDELPAVMSRFWDTLTKKVVSEDIADEG